MSAQPNGTNNGSSRKRPHESTIANGNGLLNGETIRPEESPLMVDGQTAMGQFLPILHAYQVQGNTFLRQALVQAPANVQNIQGAHGAAPASFTFLNKAPVQATQTPPSFPAIGIMHHNHNENNDTSYSTAHQQAVVANLFQQALAQAQANVQSNQVTPSSVPTAFPLPNMAPVQTNQVPAGFSVNNMMINPYQYQIHTPAAFPSQLNPAPVQAQPQGVSNNTQPGQLRPFGMEPQELLNYAVMVNILHTSNARGNASALSDAVLNRPQGANQEPVKPSNQEAQQGVTHGVTNQVGAPAALPQNNQMIQSPSLVLNQANVDNNDAFPPSVYLGHTVEHTVSPSIPSESNFITGSITLPRHVVEAKRIDPKVRCVPLWTPQDETRLSTQQCWLRKQIETYPASQRDVRRHTRGRNRVLKLGQVGIQCIHCKNLPQEGRGKGSSYFISSTKGIYQAAQNILSYHFKEDTCPIISQKLLQEMREAGSSGCPRHLAPKAGKSRSGGGKSFWEDAAVHITGLIDTTVGIRYADDGQNYCRLESVTLGMTESGLSGANYCPSESVLVCCEDKGVATDFVLLLMSQFVPHACPYSSGKSMSEYCDGDSDLDDDEDRRVGIACRFCTGVSYEGKHRDGVFLSTKPGTMMRNKQLTKLHNHIVSCRYVPEDLKRNVITAKEIHLPQNDHLKRGWKKVFFEKVSLRLKQALDAVGDSSGGETSSSSCAAQLSI